MVATVSYVLLMLLLADSIIQLGLMVNLHDFTKFHRKNSATYELFDLVNTVAQAVHVVECSVLT